MIGVFRQDYLYFEMSDELIARYPQGEQNSAPKMCFVTSAIMNVQ